MSDGVCDIRASGSEIGWAGDESAFLGDVQLGEPCLTAVSGQVRSLYTMLRFYAERFVRTYRRLGTMQDLLQRRGDDDISDSDYQLLLIPAHALLADITQLNLSVSTHMVETFRRHTEEHYSTSTLLAELTQLFAIIEAELNAVIFLQIPNHRLGYYEFAGSQLEDSVLQQLPSTVSDLEEGAKCFALGRHTACIFHLMRVMEISVQILGKKLKIPLTSKTAHTIYEKPWQNIIDEVNKAIKAMQPKTIRRKRLQGEYAAIAAHLFHVKVAWRNSVMHPKASYTEEEAGEVLRAVLSFVNHLARTLQPSR